MLNNKSKKSNEENKVIITINYNKVIDYSNYFNDLLIVLSLPEGVKEIGISSFENCVNLQRIILPESINRLNRRCFYNCKSLNNLYIPKDLCTIDEECFNNCISLNLLIIDNIFFKTENRFNNTNIKTLINYKNVIYLKYDLFNILSNNCNFLINNLLTNDIYDYINKNNLIVNDNSIIIYFNNNVEHSIPILYESKLIYKKTIFFSIYE